LQLAVGEVQGAALPVLDDEGGLEIQVFGVLVGRAPPALGRPDGRFRSKRGALWWLDEPSGPLLFLNFKGISMNKDQIKGAAKDAAGKVQEKVGVAIGSTDQQDKGVVKQVEGKVQKAYGDVKEVLKDGK
jgi:uncharacterized protein YjbJ (UPF0337 family)